jgi:hypothetical protein
MRSRLASHSFAAAMAAPRGPAWRARHADMSGVGFIGLVAGWCSAIVLILFLSTFIRLVG